MNTNAPDTDLERRKHVRLRRRVDLGIVPQRYEGRSYYVVKDPVSLRYYRFKEQEHYLLQLMDGTHTLDEAQKLFDLSRGDSCGEPIPGVGNPKQRLFLRNRSKYE